MANTYSQLPIHLVFAVKHRAALIGKPWKEELHKYITGIFQANGHKMLQINSVPDHIHILFGLDPRQAISGLVQNVKSESSKWIKEKGFCDSVFRWQEGFGAFACSKSHVQNTILYIQNQEAHHAKQTFLKEYKKMLEGYDIMHDDWYIFTEPV